MEKIPTNPLSALIRGFKYPFSGLSFISKNRLWKICLPSILVNILLLVSLLVLLFTCGANFNNFISGLLPNSDVAVLSWLLAVAKGTVKVILFIIELLLVLVLLNSVGSVICSPFLDMISERVEKEQNLLEIPKISIWHSIVLSLKNSIKCLGANVFFWIIFLPINLIPGLGSGLYFVASGCCTAIFNTLQYLSYPLDRRLIPFGDDWSVIKKNKMVCLGFGLSVNLITCVPFLQLLILPLASVGGTMLFTDLWWSEYLPPEVFKKCQLKKIQ